MEYAGDVETNASSRGGGHLGEQDEMGCVEGDWAAETLSEAVGIVAEWMVKRAAHVATQNESKSSR